MSQAESKDEAEKPSESAEKLAEGEKVKSEMAEPSEREEGESEGGEGKATAGRVDGYSIPLRLNHPFLGEDRSSPALT